MPYLLLVRNKIYKTGMVFMLFALPFLSCSSVQSPLTELERQKLDICLQDLILGKEGCPAYDEYMDSDGSKRYGVMIWCEDVESLRAAGIPVGSTSGRIVTARLTITELRYTVTLRAVTRVENPDVARPF